MINDVKKKTGWRELWVELTTSGLSGFRDSIGWRNNNPTIDYSTNLAGSAYGLSTKDMLYSKRLDIAAPYQIIIDYRNTPATDSWGIFEIHDQYKFPHELEAHKQMALDLFKKNKWLKKDNNPAPRVRSVSVGSKNGHHKISIEQATYFDQVGTNLVMDLPFGSGISCNENQAQTIREWDIAQAGLNKKLPTFSQSRLANTIGVAIAITSKNMRTKEKHLLRRYRSNEVAVYRNMWHLPFSFALIFDKLRHGAKQIEINHLINFDLPNEFAEELGLEICDFLPVKPIAFARDLARGGKPQFFLEMETTLSFDELQKKAHRGDGEYRGKIQQHPYTAPSQNSSPELVASAILLESET